MIDTMTLGQAGAEVLDSSTLTVGNDVGIFTLSLDCEGLWGMADDRATMTSGRIGRRELEDVYQFICGKLDQEGLFATAAFVSGFAAPQSVLQSCLHDFESLADRYPRWFEHILPRLRNGGDEALGGLEGHACWKMLSERGHEMAWHGATHLPLDETLSDEAVQAELELGRKLWNELGQVPTSIVFPRNLVGHLDALYRAGFSAFRNSRRADGFDRVLGMAREWDIFDDGDPCKASIRDGWCVVPAGHFLNWRSGPRKLVAPSVTLSRWRSMLGTAVQKGRHVHMWFHPHNLITAPTMRELFSSVMNEVGDLVRRGDLLNLTMSQIERRCRGFGRHG